MNAKGEGRAAKPYSSKAKTHINIFYCHSWGYYVYHDGWSWPYKKEGHIQNMRRDEVHEYYGLSMKLQNKCLPGEFGMGKGHEIYFNQQKEYYTAEKINKQKNSWKQGCGDQWNVQNKQWNGG